MINLDKEIIKRLIALRRSKGLTQEQVARNSGISRRYINKMENGHIKRLKFDMVMNYLYACKADLIEFFTDLEKVVKKNEYNNIISQIKMPEDYRIRKKVDRDITLYHTKIQGKIGKAKPLSKESQHKAVIKFGNYRVKIEHIQSLGYNIIAQSGISTIQNPFYRAYINQLCKAIKKNLSAQKTKFPSFNKSDSSYQAIINQWIKKGAREDLLNQIRDEILKYFAPVKIENKVLSTKTQSYKEHKAHQ
jgi:transcriptional regulator with XRE-family HTH domain